MVQDKAIFTMANQ